MTKRESNRRKEKKEKEMSLTKEKFHRNKNYPYCKTQRIKMLHCVINTIRNIFLSRQFRKREKEIFIQYQCKCCFFSKLRKIIGNFSSSMCRSFHTLPRISKIRTIRFYFHNLVCLYPCLHLRMI